MDRIKYGPSIPCFLERAEAESVGREKAFILAYRSLPLNDLISRIEKELEKQSIEFSRFTIKADLIGVLTTEPKTFTLACFNKRSRDFTINHFTIRSLEDTQAEISLFTEQTCKSLTLRIS